RAAHDGGVGPDARSAAHARLLIHVSADDLAARVDDVGKNAGRPKKDIVFDDGAGVERYVVLNLDVVADQHMAGDMDVLPQDAALADLAIRHDMAEVPNLGAFPDVTGNVNIGRRVSIIAG